MMLPNRTPKKPLAAMLDGAATKLGEVTTLLDACRVVAQQERLYAVEDAIECLCRDAQPLAARAKGIIGALPKRSDEG